MYLQSYEINKTITNFVCNLHFLITLKRAVHTMSVSAGKNMKSRQWKEKNRQGLKSCILPEDNASPRIYIKSQGS